MSTNSVTAEPDGLNHHPKLHHETADGLLHLCSALALGAPKMAPHYRVSIGGADGPTGSFFWIIVSANGAEVWNADGLDPQQVARKFLDVAVLEGTWS